MAGCSTSVTSSVNDEEGRGGFIFRREHTYNLLRNKHIVVIGDSIMRSVYKDLVCAVQFDRLCTETELERKWQRDSFLGDTVVRLPDTKTTGKDFFESREYHAADGAHLIEYYFVTRCYYGNTEGILCSFVEDPPDIVIMNSLLWDISRYGSKGGDEFLSNLATLCHRLREVLHSTAMFIWLTTPPVSSEIAPNLFLMENLEHLSVTLRKCVLDYNNKSAQIVALLGYDVLDLNYYLRPFIDKHRRNDGVHWDAVAHRHVTELILAFLHDSWGEPLPETAMKTLALHFETPQLSHLKDVNRPNFVHRLTEHFSSTNIGAANANNDQKQISSTTSTTTAAAKRRKRRNGKAQQSTGGDDDGKVQQCASVTSTTPTVTSALPADDNVARQDTSVPGAVVSGD